MCRGERGYSHLFVTWMRDACKWSHSHPDHFNWQKEPSVHCKWEGERTTEAALDALEENNFTIIQVPPGFVTYSQELRSTCKGLFGPVSKVCFKVGLMLISFCAVIVAKY